MTRPVPYKKPHHTSTARKLSKQTLAEIRELKKSMPAWREKTIQEAYARFLSERKKCGT